MLLASGKRKTNVSQAVRTTMKEIIHIREPRTEASNSSMADWREEPELAPSSITTLDVDLGFMEAKELSEGDHTILEEQALPARAKSEGKLEDYEPGEGN